MGGRAADVDGLCCCSSGQPECCAAYDLCKHGARGRVVGHRLFADRWSLVSDWLALRVELDARISDGCAG